MVIAGRSMVIPIRLLGDVDRCCMMLDCWSLTRCCVMNVAYVVLAGLQHSGRPVIGLFLIGQSSEDVRSTKGEVEKSQN